MPIAARIALGLLCLVAPWRPGAAEVPSQGRATPASLRQSAAIPASLPDATSPGLHDGAVLFHFLQDDHFNGIVRMTASREQGLIASGREDSELVLARMYLAFGQHAQAMEVLDRLLDAPTTPAPVRDRAWFTLGRALHARGRWADSERALRRVSGPLPEDMDAERGLLLAQDLMWLGRFDRAVLELQGRLGPPEWLAYARFNLAVALIRSGHDAEGLALLEQVGTVAEGNEELRSLRDKANVAAGFARLRADQPVEAAAALARVRLNGPQSAQALLAAGWAEAAQGHYDRALAMWQELRARDGRDSAVQEARLAVPYAQLQLGAESEAAANYEAAILAFESESRRLDESIDAIRRGGMLESLAHREELRGDAWYSRLTALPDTAESRYLYALMAGNEFQEGLRDYQALGFVLDNLRDWRASIATFRDLLDSRRRTFAERLPAALATLDRVDVAAIERHRDALRSRLDAAVRDEDVVALASDPELDSWKRILRVEGALDARPDDVELDEARDRLHLARGALFWTMNREFPLRRSEAGRSLRALSTAVDELRARVTLLRAARHAVPQRNRELLARIAAIEPRIERLLAAAGAARERHARHLASLAVAELEAQKSRLADYRTQARYGLAILYDRASRRPASAMVRP